MQEPEYWTGVYFPTFSHTHSMEGWPSRIDVWLAAYQVIHTLSRYPSQYDIKLAQLDFGQAVI